eukprot:1157595-Pelagomonas_calceolata.AAC.12
MGSSTTTCFFLLFQPLLKVKIDMQKDGRQGFMRADLLSGTIQLLSWFSDVGTWDAHVGSFRTSKAVARDQVTCQARFRFEPGACPQEPAHKALVPAPFSYNEYLHWGLYG